MRHDSNRSCSTLLERPILQYFGFEDETIFPRNTAEFIQGQGEKSFHQTTFRRFVEESGNGLHLKDRGDSRTIAQVASARVAKWLDRLVLAAQDILVDAPHLVVRYPGLLDPLRIGELDTWNATTDLFEPTLVGEKIAGAIFKHHDWLTRKAWLGRLISNSNDRESLAPWQLDKPDYVFCEDRSRFCDVEDAKEFVADVASAYVRRFVGWPTIPGVRYQPSVRFSI